MSRTNTQTRPRPANPSAPSPARAEQPELVADDATEVILLWLRRGMEAIWLLAVLLVPLAALNQDLVLSEAVIAYAEVPKIAVLRTLASLAAIFWLVEWGLQLRFVYGFPAIDRALLLQPAMWWRRWVGWLAAEPTRWPLLAVWFSVGVTLLSTIFSASFSVSLWGEVPGQDGYPAYTIMAYFVLFGVIVTHLKTRPQLWRLIGTLVAMGVLVGGYGVLQHYGYDFLNLMEPSSGDRVTSTMGNAVFAGAVLLLTIPISLLAATLTCREPVRGGMEGVKNFKQWAQALALLAIWSLVLAVQSLGLVFTLSRGSWLGTMTALAVFLTLAALFVGWRASGRATLVLTLPVILMVAVVQWPGAFALLAIGLLVVFGLAVALVNWSAMYRLVQGLAVATAIAGAITILVSWSSARLGDADGTGSPGASADSTSSQVAQRFTSIREDVVSGELTGRVGIWQDSWDLMVHRPWFEFDSLSLPWLRPIIGYGPDLFRYVYLLESVPRGGTRVPAEPDHAHNYFIHQGTEMGFLGLVSSLGIYLALFLTSGFQLLKKRHDYSEVHKLMLVGLLAVFGGRFLEQMVGVARVADLTLFWVLAAVLVTLPGMMLYNTNSVDQPFRRTLPQSRNSGSRHHTQSSIRPQRQMYRWQHLGWLAMIALAIGAIMAITWVKTINYPIAAVSTTRAVERFSHGDLQGAVHTLDYAATLAPDIPVYHNFKSIVYQSFVAYRDDARVSPESECILEPQGVPYEACLAQKAYFSNLAGEAQRPYYWRSKLALADSALTLRLDAEAIEKYQEAIDLVPASWPLRRRLVEAYLETGQPQEALEAANELVSLIGDIPGLGDGRFVQGLVYLELGKLEDAASSLTRSIELGIPERDLLVARRQLVEIYLRLGQPELAEKYRYTEQP